jgi:hypothetical protein
MPALTDLDLLLGTRRELAADLADLERALPTLADDDGAYRAQRARIAQARDHLEQLDDKIEWSRRRAVDQAEAAAAERERERQAERARLKARQTAQYGQVETALGALHGAIGRVLETARQRDTLDPIGMAPSHLAQAQQAIAVRALWLLWEQLGSNVAVHSGTPNKPLSGRNDP